MSAVPIVYQHSEIILSANGEKVAQQEVIAMKDLPWVQVVKFLIPVGHVYRTALIEFAGVVLSRKAVIEGRLYAGKLEEILMTAIKQKRQELIGFLKDKSPDQFINGLLNLLPKFMDLFMTACNWDPVSKDLFRVRIYKNITLVECGQASKIIVKLPLGSRQIPVIKDYLEPVFDVLLKSEVSIYIRKYPAYWWNIISGNMTMFVGHPAKAEKGEYGERVILGPFNGIRAFVNTPSTNDSIRQLLKSHY